MDLHLAVAGGEMVTVLSCQDWGSSMCYVCHDKDEAILLADRVSHMVELVDIYSEAILSGEVPLSGAPVTKTRAQFYHRKIEELKDNIDTILSEGQIYGGTP